MIPWIHSHLRRLAITGFVTSLLLATATTVSAQNATPPMTSTMYSCDATATPAAPGTMGDHRSMRDDMADSEQIEFDQMYIDMMLPHHGSVIALAEVALPHLTHPDLIDMAENIIATQTAENEMLSGWRMDWYGSAEPDMSDHSMSQMMDAMPMGSMDSMMRQMDANWQVATFCSAENPDRAFAEQVIPHHQMAIDTSEVAVEQAIHPELAEFAARVIVDQQAEIDLLNQILAEIQEATPEA